ncbi:MAG TPA: hypothetical protein VF868_07985 [Bacteroidia bacterium]
MNRENKYLPFIALFLIVLISRLPFLSAGYGVEEDSWGIALAAFHTKLSGIYEPSRFPGHPVQELIYSALWGTGPVVFNLLCAIFSAAATVYFALIMRHFNFRHYFLAALAFAFVPVVYISSTYTIDFMWSETFVLMSFYLLLKNRLVSSGILLGLAVGCRITCGVMVLPYMLILWQQGDLRSNMRSFFKITIPMGIVSLIAFLPVIIQFGTSFFMYYDQFPYPPLSKVIYKMTFGVFGFIGFTAILFFMLIILSGKNKNGNGELFAGSLDKRVVSACYLLIALYVISYFRLPQKSGYMLPVIPFAIILFGYYLSSKQFRIFSIAMILSSFFSSINLTDKLRGAEHSALALKHTISGQEIFFDVLSGPVFSDYSKRKLKMKYTDEVIQKIKGTSAKTLIISGWWYNEVVVTMLGAPTPKNVVLVPYINEEEMKRYVTDGYSITYLPEQDKYNDLMHKINSTDQLAQPF